MKTNIQTSHHGLLAMSSSCAMIIVLLWIAPNDTVAKRSLEPSASSFITTITPRHTWENLALRYQSIEHLKALSNMFKQRSTSQAGIDKRLYLKSEDLTAIFVGPDHIGKLAAAEAIAFELKRPLYKVDVSGFASKYIGETEKNLASFFHKAQTQEAILFFDEADALFGKRTDVSDAHGQYANIETNILIESMSTYNGLVILSTNKRPNRTISQVLQIHISIEFPCAAFQDCQ